MPDDITELDRIDVLAMVLQGKDGDHPFEFWRSRAHRLLNHREPLLAVLGMVDSGLMYCTTHHGVIECDEGDGPCDFLDHRAPCDGEGVTPCVPTPLLYEPATEREG